MTTLTNLQQLYLNNNQLTGTIPAELSKLTNLRQLHLSSNQLTGVIPVELTTLANLQQLYLYDNQLTGTIPADLGKLTNLWQLQLSSNQLTGTIPAELGKLANLLYLALNSNDLTGTIPAELGKLTNLYTLNLAANDLTGMIPTELDNLVPPTGKLSSVRIATGNPGLCGPIPPALHALSPTHPNDVNDLGSDTYPTGNLRSCSSAPLAAPALTAEASAGAVELRWQAAPGATRYELSTWWNAEIGWQPLGGDNLTGTSYTHTDVTAGTTYYYSIRAVNAAGETSPWLRDYPSATVPAAANPLTTPELTADAVDGAVELSWNAVTGAARYELSTWWASDPGWQPLGGDNLTDTSFTHTDVTAGTTYYYSIRAINTAGETSDWLQKNPSATVPTAATPLTAPELTAKAARDAVELSWNAVTGAARYQLWTWWDTDPGWQRLDDGSLTDTSYTHDGLTAGTTYFYAVCAVDAGGNRGAYSQNVPATVPDPSAGPDTAGERAALVALYNAANGPNWTQNDNWLSEEPLAAWYGVATDENGSVTELRLPDIGLSGPLPDLSALTNLTSLDLESNQLRGPVPALSALSSLTSLDLGHNQLSGPIPDLSALSSLTRLDLESNGLSGPLPALSALSNLTELNLAANRLSGPVPDLSTLSNLTLLSLDHNQLSGSFPDLSALTSLTSLNLGGNQLSGPFPDLSALTKLTTLSLFGNQLTGSIPDLSALTKLTSLSLGGNHLAGSIPDLSALTSLTSLNLRGNQLIGPFPDLSALSKLTYLDLGHNQLSGPISDLSALTNLTRLELYNNRLSGSVPDLSALSNLTYLGPRRQPVERAIPRPERSFQTD